MSVRMLMLGGALALLACGAPLRALPASLDPSNPDGPEGMTPPAATSVNPPGAPVPPSTEAKGAESAAPAPAHHHGHGSHDMQGGHEMPQPMKSADEKPADEKPADGAKGGTESAPSYTCTMHPEVVQPSPGRCPKCDMKLVPKQAHPTGAKPSPAAPAQKKDEGHGSHTHHMEATPGSKP